MSVQHPAPPPLTARWRRAEDRLAGTAADRAVVRLIGRRAAIAAALIALVPPLTYLIGDLRQLQGALEADARAQAAIVSQNVNRNPGVWQFAVDRLQRGLPEVRDPQRRTRVVDASGATVVELPAALQPPVIVREAEFHEFGTPVGLVRVEASFGEGLLHAALLLFASAAAGALVFFPLRNIPLAALRRAQLALAESERRHRTVVEGLREGVLLVDTRMRVLAANPGAARVLGVGEEVLRGADLAALFRDAVFAADGTPLAPDQWPIGRAFASGEPQEGFVCRLRRAGRAEQWLRVNVQPIGDGMGSGGAVVASFEDQTEAVRARERLMLTEEAFRSTADGIFIADADARLIYANRAFGAITGLAPEESLGRDIGGLGGVHAPLMQAGGGDEGKSAAWSAGMLAAVLANGAWHGDFIGRRKGGQAFAAWLSVNAVCDDAGRLTHIVGSLSDISERVQHEERIRSLAQHDILTGLPNRATLRENMALMLAGARRRGGEVGVLFIDLDHFKAVNDTLGHAAGDQVLVEVARRLTHGQPDGDLVSRLGGDEFVVVLPDRNARTDVANVAQRMLRRLSEPYSIDGREFLLTPSIGISVFPGDGGDADELLSNADTAMYAAKQNGRGNFRFYSAAMNSGAAVRLELAAAVRRGLERGEFVLHYQPQLAADGRRPRGVEALLRWRHPQRGLLAAAEFMPAIDGSRLAIELGEWALAEALRQARAWSASGAAPLPMAVNVAALHFRQEGFVSFLREFIGAGGLPAGGLEIEVTEGLVGDRAEGVLEKMQELRGMGVSLCLDDFGSGGTSLAHLTAYPFQRLKIDLGRVRRITADARELAIVEAILALAHALGIEVVAEGVEREAEAELLRQRRCDSLQGHLFAPALPPDECAAWLAAAGAPGQAAGGA